MLHEFLSQNREQLLRRIRRTVAARAAPRPTHEELEIGIPLFFDLLIETLHTDVDADAAIKQGATLHGKHRLQMGFTVAQVVHDYGDVCQSVTKLAIDLNRPISTEDFMTLNRCIDDAIAQAVTEHVRVREMSISDKETERLGVLAHELRNLINAASLAFEALKTGTVAIGGSTGAVLGRSLSGLRDLVDRNLAQVRLDSGALHSEPIDLREFMGEVEVAGMIAAKACGKSFSVDSGDADIAVEGDRQLLGSAVANLVQNAFKFSRRKGHIRLRVRATSDRVLIEVEDECGGLPPRQFEELFAPYQQRGRDRTGLGLGLAISKRATEAMGGVLRVRNEEATGCVFTVDLPRLSSVVSQRPD